MARSRKRAAQPRSRIHGVTNDFVKKRTKLGKRARVTGNDTDTQVRTRKIFLPSQASIEVAAFTNAIENESSKPMLWNIQVTGFIQKTRHHNGRARVDALNSMRGVVCELTDYAEAPFWIGNVLDCALDCLEDDVQRVRRASLSLLSRIVLFLGRRVAPFAPLVIAKVASVLSSLHLAVRVDGAIAISAMLDSSTDWKFNEALMVKQILEPFADLLRVVKKQTDRKAVLEAIYSLVSCSSVGNRKPESYLFPNFSHRSRNEKFWYNKIRINQKLTKSSLPREVGLQIVKEILKIFTECLPDCELPQQHERMKTLSASTRTLESIVTRQRNSEMSHVIAKSLLPAFPLSESQGSADTGSKCYLRDSNLSIARLLVFLMTTTLSSEENAQISETVSVFVLSFLDQNGLKSGDSSSLIRDFISVAAPCARTELWTRWVESWKAFCRHLESIDNKTGKKECKEQKTFNIQNRFLCHQSHYEFIWDMAVDGVTDVWPIIETFPRLLFDLLRLGASDREICALLRLLTEISKKNRKDCGRLSRLGEQACSYFLTDRENQVAQVVNAGVTSDLVACLYHTGASRSLTYTRLILRLSKNSHIVKRGVVGKLVRVLEWSTLENQTSEESKENLLGLVVACLVQLSKTCREHRTHQDQIYALDQSLHQIAQNLGLDRDATEKLVQSLL